jgi:hypothetical protein
VTRVGDETHKGISFLRLLGHIYVRLCICIYVYIYMKEQTQINIKGRLSYDDSTPCHFQFTRIITSLNLCEFSNCGSVKLNYYFLLGHSYLGRSHVEAIKTIVERNSVVFFSFFLTRVNFFTSNYFVKLLFTILKNSTVSLQDIKIIYKYLAYKYVYFCNGYTVFKFEI